MDDMNTPERMMAPSPEPGESLPAQAAAPADDLPGLDGDDFLRRLREAGL
jgi:hypothetical protein